MTMHRHTLSPSDRRGTAMRLIGRWEIGPWMVLCVLFLLTLAVFALFGNAIAPHTPEEQDLLARLQPPAWIDGGDWSRVLGTDHLGRDLLSRLIVGARISLFVAVVSVLISGTLGVAIGLVAGYFGGRFDAILMRLADMQLAIPFILLAIIIIGIFGPSLPNIIGVLVVTNWVAYARVIRSEVITIKERQFVEAARALGQNDGKIVVLHILPNAFNAILVVATLDIGRMIFFESALSFLGLGLPPPVVSWGGMLSDGKLYMASAWWLATFPGIIISLAILSVNLLGDWLRDVLDPRA